MRDPLRAIKRQLENRFESQRWQSSEKTEKLLAAGAAVLAIVVIGGALFFKKGGKVAIVYEGLMAAGTKIESMQAEISALNTRAASLQNEAEEGKANGDKVSDLRAKLDAVRKNLELESATLAQQTLAITNHVNEAAHQESRRAILVTQVETATAGQIAAQRVSTELTAKLSEKETEIRVLSEHVAKKDSAEARAASSLADVTRLESANTRLLAETQTANRERTKALDEKAKVDETLRDALAKLAAADVKGARLGEAFAGLTELLASCEAADDALNVAKVQIDDLRKRNIDLLETANEVERTKDALRLAESANKRLDDRILLIETQNEKLRLALEDSETELVVLRGVSAQVEAMRESVDSFAGAASTAIKRVSKAELGKQDEALRADIAEQSGAVLNSVVVKLATVVAAQEHTAIQRLQHHLLVINEFSGVYESVLGQLRDTEGELKNAQAEAGASKILAERLQAQLVSTDERVAAQAQQLLLANANQEKAAAKAWSRAAAGGKELAKSASKGSQQLAQQYDTHMADLKDHYDTTIVGLKANIAANEDMRAKHDERALALTAEKQSALGRVLELQASVKRLADDLTLARAENAQLLLDLNVADSEVTQMNTQNKKVIADALATKGSLLLEVATTKATAGSEMANLEVLTDSFFAILVALSAFTEGAKGLAGKDARATASEAASLSSEFARAFDAATLVLKRVVGEHNMECVRIVIAESARLTSHTASSLALAIGERDVAIGERDAANAGSMLSHKSLMEEMRTRVVAIGERDGAIGERDVASDAFRGVILGHFDPSQIVRMLDSKTGNGAGATVDVDAVCIDDTAKAAKSAVAGLGIPDLIWLFRTLTTHWATTVQERVDQKVRSMCFAMKIRHAQIPRALTATGLVDLEAWLLEFDSKVRGFVKGIRSSVPDVVSGDKTGKRQRVDVSSAAGEEQGDLQMIHAFGAIQTSREVSHFDFLGAFLSVQRMLITCAAIEAGLLGIEATAAMASARFGRQMRRAYV